MIPASLHQFDAGAPPSAPHAPVPAIALTRVKLTPVDALTITAMLDAPGVLAGAGCATTPRSSNAAPVAKLSTSSAYPVAVGATIAGAPVYAHAAAPPSADASLPALAGHASPP